MINKTVIKLNFSIDITLVKQYYETLIKDFSHKRWVVGEQLQYISAGRAELSQLTDDAALRDVTMQLSGWGILDYTDNDSQIMPPWGITTGVGCIRKKSDLEFGIAAELINKIPGVRRAALSVIPMGAEIIKHSDEDMVIHVPLYSPVNSKFIFHDPDYTEYTLDADGSVYLCDTRIPHEVKNQGPGDRVHLFLFVDPNILTTDILTRTVL
jgi:hypothetical protein